MGLSDIDDGERVQLDWPADRTCYLTLDLECDFGTALSENTYGALDQVPAFVSFLERYNVPLTCFVQTEVLDVDPQAVERLRSASVDVSFHPHSHTHPRRDAADVAFEVAESTERFEGFFGEQPIGYRFPNGDVRPSDYAALAEYGYDFDASVFPTWRPGHFDNRDATRTPEFLLGFDLYELPFTTLRSWFPIPTSLSFCRVLGRPFIWALSRWSPSTVVFNVHLHDLTSPPSVENLPGHYRIIYARNPDGFGVLERVLNTLAEKGYSFDQLDGVPEELPVSPHSR